MRDDDPEEPPGTVSDQNQEEPSAPHGGDEGLERRNPDASDEEHEGGEAGEGSQSTGHPESAG